MTGSGSSIMLIDPGEVFKLYDRMKWCSIDKSNRKEYQVREQIEAHFEGFIHNKALGDSSRRIDHRKLVNGTMIAIEDDEYAHPDKDKDYESDRNKRLQRNHEGRWICIRFNPDDNRERDGHKTSLEHKIKTLMAEIKKQIRRIENSENNGSDLVETIKLFF